MNCCDANGNCNQGRDCPIRKQRRDAANNAYIQNGLHDDPIDDLADTFKALIAVIAVLAALTLFTFWYWGK